MIKVIKNSKYLILLCLLMTSSLIYGQGSRYTGTYKKSAPLVYKNKSDIVIEGLIFENSPHRSITLWGGDNITIKNCKFKNGINEWAIMVEKGTNITVIDCTFENVYGSFRAILCTDNIKFEHNDVKNVVGDLYISSRCVQAVQFDRCNGSGNSISYNVIENIEGESSPDDNINLFNSNGTPESPIRIASNWIRGGGPSLSGGGIMLADHGGSYLIAEDNIVVNPGQYGMAIAGGHNITVRNNKIFSKKRPVANVGLYANNWTQNITTGKSYNITIENNEVNWTNREGRLNTFWFSSNMKPIKGVETNKYNGSLDESILPDVIINRINNTNEDSPAEGKPNEDDSDKDNPEEGKPNEDDSDKDNPEEDKPNEDDSDKDNPEEGKPNDDNTDKDNPEEGKPNEDDSDKDNPEEDKPNEDDSDKDNPEEVEPEEENGQTSPELNLSHVYIDSFKRIAVKYLDSTISDASAECYTSDDQLIGSIALTRYKKTFPVPVADGEYYVKITYEELGKSEIKKITVN